MGFIWVVLFDGDPTCHQLNQNYRTIIHQNKWDSQTYLTEQKDWKVLDLCLKTESHSKM